MVANWNQNIIKITFNLTLKGVSDSKRRTKIAFQEIHFKRFHNCAEQTENSSRYWAFFRGQQTQKFHSFCQADILIEISEQIWESKKNTVSFSHQFISNLVILKSRFVLISINAEIPDDLYTVRCDHLIYGAAHCNCFIEFCYGVHFVGIGRRAAKHNDAQTVSKTIKFQSMFRHFSVEHKPTQSSTGFDKKKTKSSAKKVSFRFHFIFDFLHWHDEFAEMKWAYGVEYLLSFQLRFMNIAFPPPDTFICCYFKELKWKKHKSKNTWKLSRNIKVSCQTQCNGHF